MREQQRAKGNIAPLRHGIGDMPVVSWNRGKTYRRETSMQAWYSVR